MDFGFKVIRLNKPITITYLLLHNCLESPQLLLPAYFLFKTFIDLFKYLHYRDLQIKGEM